MKMHKSIVLVMAALLVLAACSQPSQDVTRELSTSELDSASAELDQLDQEVNEADFETLETELAELENLELE